MAATWQIVKMDRNTADGGVTTVHWQVTDSETVGDDTFSGRVYGSQGFIPDADADADGFVAFDSIDEATAIGWVKEAMGDETVAANEAAVAAQIEVQKNPVSASGLPW